MVCTGRILQKRKERTVQRRKAGSGTGGLRLKKCMFVLHGTQGMGNRYGDFRQVVWNPVLIEVINFFSVFGGGDNVVLE
jgi:hypothetical protein